MASSTATTPSQEQGEHTPGTTETTHELATAVISLLRASNATLAVAESLTAGLLMAALTSVPGASAIFRGGVVSYATALKQSLLGVDAGLLAREGAVHGGVAAQMAEGVRRVTTPGGAPGGGVSGGGEGGEGGEDEEGEGEGKGEGGAEGVTTTWGVGTTGVAGPDMQDGKPVGTVYIGIASPGGSRAVGPFLFPGSRERVREATVLEALSVLRKALEEERGVREA